MRLFFAAPSLLTAAAEQVRRCRLPPSTASAHTRARTLTPGCKHRVSDAAQARARVSRSRGADDAVATTAAHGRRARGFGLFDDIGRDAAAARKEEAAGSHRGDVGILTGRGEPYVASTCDGESVTCAGGTVDGGTDTCAAACGGECCVGTAACEGFTGVVCKDGSCAGSQACKLSAIGLVKDGCKGADACWYVAGNGGSLGVVDNACHGERACYRTADYTESTTGGSIGRIQNSCLATKACYFAAVSGGSIGTILDSCNAERACESAAMGKGQGGGTIDTLSSSCNATLACYYLAGNSGNAGIVASSCNDASACYKA